MLDPDLIVIEIASMERYPDDIVGVGSIEMPCGDGVLNTYGDDDCQPWPADDETDEAVPGE